MPNSIDIYVGKRVRLKRKLMHLTQTDLAIKLNLTFQQIQKYEKGDNRISASKLYRIADALEEQVGFFFEGYDDKKEVLELPEITCDIVRLVQALEDRPEGVRKKHLKNFLSQLQLCNS